MPDLNIMSIPYAIFEERRNSPRYNWNNHLRRDDPNVIFQYTLEGAGVFEINGVAHPVEPEHGFLAIVPERSRYFYPQQARQPWIFRWINIYGDFGIKLWRDFRENFGPTPCLPFDSPAERIFREITHLLSTQRNPDTYVIGEMGYQFYLTWGRQLQSQQPLPNKGDPVMEAEKFCLQHFRRPITVKEIAAHLGLSREHFTRLFRARHRLGPAAYLRAIRLKEARRLQRGTRMPLKELALRTGFPSARQLGKYLG